LDISSLILLIEQISFGQPLLCGLLPRRGPHIASHSVCLSVCLSVRPVMIITERHVAPPSELQWHARRAA